MFSFVDSFFISALKNTLILILGTIVLSSIIALPSAWLIERTNLYGKKYFDKFFTLPYAIPSYLIAIAWIFMANPSVGLINLIFRQFFPGSESFIDIYNIWGLIFIESSVIFPILFLSFQASLKSLDPSLEEASRIHGAGPLKTFFTITLPLLKNSINSGLLSIALAVLASFGVPLLIGAPARIHVITTVIYGLVKDGSDDSFNKALQISILLSLVTLILVLGSLLIKKRQFSLVSGKSTQSSRIDLGSWRLPVSLGLLLLWGGLIFLPIIMTFLSSFLKQPGLLSWSNLSLDAWKYVYSQLPGFYSAIFVSLQAALLSAFIMMSIALGLSLLNWSVENKKVQHPFVKTLVPTLESFFLFTYSLPGTVLALLLIILFTSIPDFGVRDALPILVIAYVTKYTLLAIKVLSPQALMIDKSLIESATLLGASKLTKINTIWLPLLKSSLIACFIIVFMPTLSELTMSILLYGPESESLGVTLFTLQEYADRSSAAVVASSIIFFVVLIKLLQKEENSYT